MWVKTVHGDYVNLELASRVYAHPEEGDQFFAVAEVGESRQYLSGAMGKPEAYVLIDKIFDSVKKNVRVYELNE
jgi:hypothetical protein